MYFKTDKEKDNKCEKMSENTFNLLDIVLRGLYDIEMDLKE